MIIRVFLLLIITIFIKINAYTQKSESLRLQVTYRHIFTGEQPELMGEINLAEGRIGVLTCGVEESCFVLDKYETQGSREIEYSPGKYKTEILDTIGRVFDKHFSAKKIICRELIHKTFGWYSDTLHQFNWNITSEKKKIEAYNCLKATTIFRGREYIAWFTPEIPLSDGPYKFWGLPGLILEIQDLNNEVFYVMESLEVISPVDKLECPQPLSEDVISRAAFIKKINDRMKRIVHLLESHSEKNGGNLSVTTSRNTIELDAY